MVDILLLIWCTEYFDGWHTIDTLRYWVVYGWCIVDSLRSSVFWAFRTATTSHSRYMRVSIMFKLDSTESARFRAAYRGGALEGTERALMMSGSERRTDDARCYRSCGVHAFMSIYCLFFPLLYFLFFLHFCLSFRLCQKWLSYSMSDAIVGGIVQPGSPQCTEGWRPLNPR